MDDNFVSRRTFVVIVGLLAALGSVVGTGSLRAVQNNSPAEASPQFYTEHVQPILEQNCYRCHAGMNHRGGLVLDSREGLMHGGKDGTVVVPGHPEQSLLVKLIRHEGSEKPMPPKGTLSDADVAAITEWIRAGAVMPADQTRPAR